MPPERSPVALSGYTCPGCGCPLENYEIFACRLRGLKKPVCIGCLASALVFLRDKVMPLLEEPMKILEAYSEKAADRKVDCHVAP